MKRHLLQSVEGPQIIEEFSKKKRLTDCSRRLLMKSCSSFCFKTFKTDAPEKSQLKQIARALIVLFPCFKSKGDNELVIDCNFIKILYTI